MPQVGIVAGITEAEAGALIAVHSALKTGVHGVGTDYIAKATNIDQLIRMADLAAAIKNAANGLAVLNGSADVLLAQIPDTLTGKDADTVDGYEAVELIAQLGIGGFQAVPAVGTMSTPANINDNDTNSKAQSNAVDQYAEVRFVVASLIKQHRHYGDGSHTGDGRFKIQYWDGDSWEDWDTDIPVEATGDWTGWITPAAGAKLTTKIRVVSTTIDTGIDWNIWGEMEIKY